MSEWKTYKLGELIEIKYGKDHKHLKSGKIPVYGSGGIMRYAEKSLYEEESILIPRKGSLSSLFYINTPFWSVDTMFYSKIKDHINGKFLYYYLKTLDFASMNVGSAVPSLTTELLNKIEIQIPKAIEEQKRITSILSSLDDKIEENHRTNQTLEALAQALFQEICVPKGEELPEGWNVRKLGEILESKGGTTPSTTNAEFWNGEYNWVTPKDLSNKTFPVLLSSERTITEKGLKQISSGLLPKGTLLMTSRAPIGYFAISQIPVAINQGFIAINGKIVSNLFLLYYLRSNIETIKGMANGSTFLEISKSVFRGIEIVIPPKNILSKFDSQVEPIFQQIVTNEQENQTLISLRDGLLPKLMKGEIEI